MRALVRLASVPRPVPQPGRASTSRSVSAACRALGSGCASFARRALISRSISRGAALAAALSASPAAAAPLAAAPAGGGQPALTVGIEGGALRAATCARAPCAVASGKDLGAPTDALGALAAVIVPLGAGRHAVHVAAPRPDGSRWEAIVAAAPGSGEIVVPFAGATGLVQGEDGLRSGPMLSISEPTKDGSRRVVVGEQREDLSLCGRPAVLSPRLLVPGDLSLRPAKVQRLSVEERDAAPTLEARRVDGAGATVPLLRAVAATSGSRPDHVTDGDPETAWSEGRGGEGRGEFVLVKMPPELPVTAFEIVVRPPTANVDRGAAPKTLFLALERRLFRVTFPEDPWASPGGRWRVELPEPATSECVAVVVDDAFATGDDVRVTLAELGAATQLDAGDLPGLVQALSAADARSSAAAAILRNLGDPAFAAVEKAFSRLDERGRRAALDVLDHAPCARGARTYARALVDRDDAVRAHASERLKRCGAEAAPVLSRMMERSKGAARIALAEQLVVMAPASAAAAIARVLGGADPATRAGLRVALGRAAKGGRADAALVEALSVQGLPDGAVLDVMRALGARLPALGAPAVRAFERVARGAADFPTRYLLLGPAAHLEASDAGARRFLERALGEDSSHFVRARAAQVVERVEALEPALLRALKDGEPRVRESACTTLGRARSRAARAALVERLAGDDWPIVRVAAARSLARSGPSAPADSALAAALADDSRHVRYAAALSLGDRGARAHAEPLRDLLDEREEHPHVRSASARALGMMCDHGSVDLLAKYARRLAEPAASEALQEIAPAALWALGQLGPADLAERLAPLRAGEARPEVRALAQRVLSQRRACPGPR